MRAALHALAGATVCGSCAAGFFSRPYAPYSSCSACAPGDEGSASAGRALRSSRATVQRGGCDVELDTARRLQLTSVTKMAEQTFITAAVESDLPAELLSAKFYVSPGVVTQ
jgi:hypothetical protein